MTLYQWRFSSDVNHVHSLSFFLGHSCSRFLTLSSCLSTTWSTLRCQSWPWGPSTRTWRRGCPSSSLNFTLRAKETCFSLEKNSRSRPFTEYWRHSFSSAWRWVMKSASRASHCVFVAPFVTFFHAAVFHFVLEKVLTKKFFFCMLIKSSFRDPLFFCSVNLKKLFFLCLWVLR